MYVGDVLEQAGPFGKVPGGAVEMDDAEPDVGSLESGSEFGECFDAGDVDLVVGVEVEQHGVYCGA